MSQPPTWRAAIAWAPGRCSLGPCHTRCRDRRGNAASSSRPRLTSSSCLPCFHYCGCHCMSHGNHAMLWMKQISRGRDGPVEHQGGFRQLMAMRVRHGGTGQEVWSPVPLDDRARGEPQTSNCRPDERESGWVAMSDGRALVLLGRPRAAGTDPSWGPGVLTRQRVFTTIAIKPL